MKPTAGRIHAPDLFLVAGNGRKSGKTAFVCRLIRQFRELPVIAIKITSGNHDPTAGLITVSIDPDYVIYEETQHEGHKDTSRMLQSGAAKVYYITISDEKALGAAFSKVRSMIQADQPAVCESPSLIRYAEPGVFVIMNNMKISNSKDISELTRFRHKMLTLEEVESMASLPFEFISGSWREI